MSAVRFGRFTLVGAMGATLQLGLIYSLMRFFRVSAFLVTPLVVELVILHNFVWHERFTWRDRRIVGGRLRALRLLRIHAGNGLVSLTGNTALTYLFVERLGAPAIASALLSIAFCSLLNYFIADRWVYAGVSVPAP